jgi:uncharacterized protein
MNKKMIFVIVSLVSILALAACSGGSTTAAYPGTVPTLNVNGTGKVYLYPDVAYINIGVHTEAESVTDALDQNSAQAQQVKDTLTAMGVDAMDIQTTSFNIYPNDVWGPDGTVTGKTYIVDNTVNVTVRDLEKLGEILSGVVESGANNINGISFDVTDKSAALAEARKLAVEDATQQATELAAAAGVTLGKVYSMSVYGGSSPVAAYDAKYFSGVGGGSVPVSAGQLVLQVDASMAFEIK